MAATFFSGFKDEQSALTFLLEQIYEGFQMQNSICVVLKDEKHCNEFKKAQQLKYFEKDLLLSSLMKKKDKKSLIKKLLLQAKEA